MSAQERLIVVGAGCGGLEVALTARSNGWQGAIDIYGAETEWPYHRPPLSKTYLKGRSQAKELVLKTPEVIRKAEVGLHLGSTVTDIDRAARQIDVTGAGSQSYGKLVLATGGRARPLPAVSTDAPRAKNLHYLRTMADAAALREALRAGVRLAIIGGGYVGLELAAVARDLGCEVVLVEAAERLLMRVTSPDVSAFYRSVHERAGVDIRTGAVVEGLICDASGERVSGLRLAEGVISCDLVVVGIGQLPNTELAAQAGLTLEDGIVVDEQCRTSDPHIFALGDCARFNSTIYGRSLRLESVPNALEQARRIGAVLCAKPVPAQTVPWFWSDQYDLQLKMAGISTSHDQIAVRGSFEEASFAAFYLKVGRLIAVDTVNRPMEFMMAKKLIELRKEVSAADLIDEARPIKDLLASDRPKAVPVYEE